MDSPEQNIDLNAASEPWAGRPAVKAIPKPTVPPYLRGPIPWDWLQAAIELGSGALPTGLAVWHLRALNQTTTFKASLNQLRKWTRLSEKVTREGVHRLEGSGLIKADRPDGQSLVITLIEDVPAD